MSEIILGIDPGKKGGLVFLDPDGNIIAQYVMPLRSKDPKITSPSQKEMEVDFLLVRELLQKHAANVCVLEKANPRPGEGVSSSFTSGLNWGYLRVICELAVRSENLFLVSPRVWANKMHTLTIEQESEPKKRSLIAAQSYFPTETFLASKRSKVPHEGLVDACLIGLWWVKNKEMIKNPVISRRKTSGKK